MHRLLWVVANYVGGFRKPNNSGNQKYWSSMTRYWSFPLKVGGSDTAYHISEYLNHSFSHSVNSISRSQLLTKWTKLHTLKNIFLFCTYRVKILRKNLTNIKSNWYGPRIDVPGQSLKSGFKVITWPLFHTQH